MLELLNHIQVIDMDKVKRATIIYFQIEVYRYLIDKLEEQLAILIKSMSDSEFRQYANITHSP